MDSSEATIYHAVILTSILLGGLFAVLVVVIIRSQRRFMRMQRQRFLREVQLLEEERTRIARDLHDELGPNLTLTDILLSEAMRNHAAMPSLLVQAQDNVVKTNRRLGEISRNLTPGSLASKGFRQALETFLGQVELTGKIGIRYSYRVDSEIKTNTGLHLFRIVQELVHNALKHSGATLLEVHLKERKGKLYILCRDNGKGIDLQDSPTRKKGLGRDSVENRVEMLGGQLQLRMNNGVEYFIALPIKENPYA